MGLFLAAGDSDALECAIQANVDEEVGVICVELKKCPASSREVTPFALPQPGDLAWLNQQGPYAVKVFRCGTRCTLGRAWPQRSVGLDGARSSTQNRSMSSDEIDAYLAGLEEPKRSTLQELRRTILEVIPEAEQGISYRLPAFRLQGKVVAGFAAFKNHLSYLPHSGSVFPQLQNDVAPYRTSSGALQFPVDKPLPKPLVEKLIRVRITQAFPE